MLLPDLGKETEVPNLRLSIEVTCYHDFDQLWPLQIEASLTEAKTSTHHNTITEMSMWQRCYIHWAKQQL